MAWNILATLDTPTSNVFTFTSLSLGSVKRLRIEILNVKVATDGTDLQVQFSIGSSFITTGYSCTLAAESSSDSNNADSFTGALAFFLHSNDANWDTGNAAAKSVQSIVEISEPGSASIHKVIQFRTAGIGPTGNNVFSSGSGLLPNAGAVDGIKVLGSANLNSGKVRLLTLT